MNNKLGDYVKQRRIDKALSLREFAKLCDLSHTHVDSIEKGYDFRTNKKVNVTNETISKLANALNVSASFLLNLSLDQENNTELSVDKQLDDVEFALLNGAKDLSMEGKKAVLRYVNFLKQEESNKDK